MHLQDHLRPETAGRQLALHIDHRLLDDVGCAALHRMVHGRALAELATLPVALGKLGNMALAAEHRLGITGLGRAGHHRVQIGAHLRIHAEIAVNHLLGLAEADAQALRQAIGLLPVHDAKVHGLRAAAHLRGHVAHRHAEHARGRFGVEVLAALERRHQVFVFGKVREQAQLDLRVVGRKEPIARRERHEALAYMPTEIGAHGNVLEVRVGRAQTSRRGDGLVE